MSAFQLLCPEWKPTIGGCYAPYVHLACLNGFTTEWSKDKKKQESFNRSVNYLLKKRGFLK